MNKKLAALILALLAWCTPLSAWAAYLDAPWLVTSATGSGWSGHYRILTPGKNLFNTDGGVKSNFTQEVLPLTSNTNGTFALTATSNTVQLGNATSGTITFNLPAATNSPKVFVFKKTDSSANAITINSAGSDTIDGATSLTLSTQYDAYLIQADGTSTWRILSKYSTAGGSGTVNSGTAGQLAYYAGSGSTVSGLNVGSGVTISSSTIGAQAQTPANINTTVPTSIAGAAYTGVTPGVIVPVSAKSSNTVTAISLSLSGGAGGVCAGPDGNIWATSASSGGGNNSIYKITPAGAVTTYTTTTASSSPTHLCAGPDGNIWFLETAANKVGKITTSGTVTEYSITTATSSPRDICVGPDGNLWFTEFSASKVAKITTSGTVTEYSTTNAPYAICAGADGNVWATWANGVMRVTPSGTVTLYGSPLLGSANVGSIALGPDGCVWGIDAGNHLYRVSQAGVWTEVLMTATTTNGIGEFGTDGNFWQINNTGAFYTSLTGVTTTFTLSTAGIANGQVCVGNDGDMWYATTAGVAHVSMTPLTAQTPNNSWVGNISGGSSVPKINTSAIPVAIGGTGTTSVSGNSIVTTNSGGTAITSATGTNQSIYFNASSVPTAGVLPVVVGGAGLAGGSVNSSGTSIRSIPTTGTWTGEYWQVGDLTTTGTITANHARLHVIGNVTIGNAVTVNTELAGGVGPTARFMPGGNGSGLGGGGGGSELFRTSDSGGGGGGGGNGGDGGQGGAVTTASQAQGPNGRAYNYENQLAGSGGGGGGSGNNIISGTSGTGGAGGGALFIEASGDITVNANITATGGNGVIASPTGAGGGGGGSGGTLAFICGGNLTLGAVTLNVSGGNGAQSSGAGGGGGRIFGRCAGTLSDSSTKTVTGGSPGTAGATAGTSGSSGVTDLAGSTGYSTRTAP